jgi:hypothetical protein
MDYGWEKVPRIQENRNTRAEGENGEGNKVMMRIDEVKVRPRQARR